MTAGDASVERLFTLIDLMADQLLTVGTRCLALQRLLEEQGALARDEVEEKRSIGREA